MNKKLDKLEGYSTILKDIKYFLEKAKLRAYKAVDNLRVQTYWQIGERINREEFKHKKRADYGEKLIERLAMDINVEKSVLYDSIQFYKIYPIFHAVHGELSWTHYRLLIRLSGEEEKQFYEYQILQNRWSTRELEKQIKSNLYNKIKKHDGFMMVKKSLHPLIKPEEIFKDSYDWNFLGLREKHNEKQLENALLNSIQRVLLEFGKGFAFMGNQEKILIAGQWHKVDLVFYHRFLKCIVLVELKTEKFKSDFVGQINKYLTYYTENKFDDENDPIGLIICKEKNKEEVYYALGKLREDIFVAEYKSYLPSEKEIMERIKNLLDKK